jgi:C4-dicarboxylate-specific signal transduction histidine kinase
MLRLIAEPLQTRKINGIGMGLALANLILRQWQGYLTARNLPIEEGGGACVEIRVPIAG